MKYSIKPTTKFQKDLKRAEKCGYEIDRLTEIIKKLANGEPLPAKNRDHSLTGDYAGCRECHIAPDWLLIYELADDTLILYLMRTGKHSDLYWKNNPAQLSGIRNSGHSVTDDYPEVRKIVAAGGG